MSGRKPAANGASGATLLATPSAAAWPDRVAWMLATNKARA
nr:MAG TPA: hypothetical protein [Caudoviricetes sp.]